MYLFETVRTWKITPIFLCDQLRQGWSCETQLLLTINDFAKSLNNNDQTNIILLNFSKAFEKVSHQHLFQKLYHYSIWGNLLTNFVLQRSQCVVVEGQQSNLTEVTSAWCTVLAPLLFLCFINDLPNNISSKIMQATCWRCVTLCYCSHRTGLLSAAKGPRLTGKIIRQMENGVEPPKMWIS